MVRKLHGEFGDKLPLYSTLTEFFVPRTKYLLRQMVSINRTMSIPEFCSLARKLGVPDSNLIDTLEALVSGGCILVHDTGEVAVQEIGREFLKFEERLEQTYKR